MGSLPLCVVSQFPPLINLGFSVTVNIDGLVSLEIV
jgi:hypothetical protein